MDNIQTAKKRTAGRFVRLSEKTDSFLREYAIRNDIPLSIAIRKFIDIGIQHSSKNN